MTTYTMTESTASFLTDLFIALNGDANEDDRYDEYVDHIHDATTDEELFNLVLVATEDVTYSFIFQIGRAIAFNLTVKDLLQPHPDLVADADAYFAHVATDLDPEDTDLDYELTMSLFLDAIHP